MSRVLPFLEHDGNRRLISEWLRQQTTFDVVEIDEFEESLWRTEFDLAVVDAQALNTYRAVVDAHREERQPEFLPVLLFVPRKLADKLSEDVWETVDDIIWTSGSNQFDSLDTFELKGRLQSLLRARDMSRTVIDNQERLRVLHRVLRHNLRNSLNVILGTATLIDDPAENDQVQRIVETTRRLLHHADNARTIDEILDDPTGKQIGIVPELTRIAESYRGEYPNAEITLSTEAPLTVKAIDGFTQVIDELVENAISHNPTGSPEVHITTKFSEDTGTISVEDNGPPIPDPDRDVLQSGLKETSLEHGSGLGLWLVAWIVRRSDGTVNYCREEDGNRISIEVPLAQ